MSFQATRFIVSLTDLTPVQKAVAHTLAYHADKAKTVGQAGSSVRLVVKALSLSLL